MRRLLAAALVLALPAVALGAPAPKRPTSRTPRQAVAIELVQPSGLALDAAGNLFISDIGTHRVLKMDKQGVLTAVAGTGEGGFTGDGKAAAGARLFAPHDLLVDAGGNLLIADTYNHRIRRIDRKGIITTIAGDGSGKYGGDGGPALKASLNNPQGIALGLDGSLFIADTYNHVVRRVDPAGIMTTFAGSEAGLSGDGGPADRAQLSLPMAVAVAPDGAVYISDGGNNRIRRVKSDGTIETVLGTGPGTGTAGAGFAGDGEPVEKAKIFGVADLELTPSGDLILSDSGNHRIRRISKGVITTIGGPVMSDPAGRGSGLRGTRLSAPQKLALHPDGTLYVADRAGSRVLRLGAGGVIDIAAGRGASPAAGAAGAVNRKSKTTQ